MRVALRIAYDGTHFFGSQTQTQTQNTVLGVLEKALKNLQIHSKAVASGRTDRGVHASSQVVHIDLPHFWKDIKRLHFTLNRQLPSSIYIKSIVKTQDDFHARFCAKKRVYRYIISQKEPNPFEMNYVTFLPSCNFETISKTIKLFVGSYDFAYFMKSTKEQKNTTRVLYKAFAYKHKGYIILHFEANGFLRSQIRLMVASLLKLKEKEIQEMLFLEKKHPLKPAPPNGLYLSKIKY